jgi:acetyltransferase-like isoleucine patch superfamily enzyme
MLKKIFWIICNKFHHYIAKPRMILGFKSRYNGLFYPYTRISNTVSIISPDQLDIVDNVYIGHYSTLEASHGIHIDEGCQISTNVLITTHSSHISIRLYGKHYIENNGQHHAYVKGPIKIGAYSFIGAFSTLMPNTTIGKGSIVSAYSYVKGDFPDFAIIGGNPAVVIGDTRKLDKSYLEQYPELQKYYDEWAK